MGADCGTVDAVMAAVRHDLGERHRHGLPNPRFAPTPEPPIDGVPTAIFWWHVAPWSAAAEPPENTVGKRGLEAADQAASAIGC